MNIRRRTKIRTIKAIINGFRRKRRRRCPRKIIRVEIPLLADCVSSTAEEFEKNFEPVGQEVIYLNGVPIKSPW